MIRNMNIRQYLPRLKEVFVKNGVILAYLFGSQAEGRAGPRSDIDIAVLFDPSIPYRDQSKRQIMLINELMGIFGRSDVDVVVLNRATPLLAHQVVKYGQVIYEDEATRPAVDFAAYTISRYADTEPLRRLRLRYLAERIEERKRRQEGKTPIGQRCRRPRGMIKTSVVIQLLDSLDDTVKTLRDLQGLSFQELAKEIVRYWGILHGLHTAVEHVTDIGAHLLGGLGLTVPDKYKDIILKMGQHYIIPYDFAERIAPMAGFRNILVYKYLTVDPAIVYDVLQHNLADFELFIEYIYGFLRREGYIEVGEGDAG